MVGKGYSGLEIPEYNPSLEIVEFVVFVAVYPHHERLDVGVIFGSMRKNRELKIEEWSLKIEFKRNKREKIEFGVKKIVEEVNIYRVNLDGKKVKNI